MASDQANNTTASTEPDFPSQKLLGIVTAVTALATALAVIIGVFIPENSAKPIAYLIALAFFAISAGIVFYRRRRAASQQLSESTESVNPSAVLRGLLPFEEGDDLPGRVRDVQELYTLVTGSTFRFGVLWGESGCGKTSLLRAGLMPTLRKQGWLPLYIPKPTKEPRDAIRLALKKDYPDLGERGDEDLRLLLQNATLRGKRVIVLFDQFEEFFLLNRTQRARMGFTKWLSETINSDLPAVFLLGVREDFFAQLQAFAPLIPEPTSPRIAYHLHNFDIDQAKQIFAEAATIDSTPFQADLIEAVVSDLEAEGIIRPAELQIVGTRLKLKGIYSANKYEMVNRSRGLLSSYISEEIKQSGSEHLARLALRLMCTDSGEAKSPTDLDLDDILRGITGSSLQDTTAMTSVSAPNVQSILDRFVAARIILRNDEGRYNLVHDYLAPYVHAATEGIETAVEQANRLLRRYIARYKEDRTVRIARKDIRDIEQFASPDLRQTDKAQELLRLSRRKYRARLTIGFATPIIILLAIGGLLAVLANSYYLSTELEPGNSLRIVVRNGSPSFDFIPGFNQVAVKTDYLLSDLVDDQSVRMDIVGGKIAGTWSNQLYGYQTWASDLLPLLNPTRQLVLMTLLDHTDNIYPALRYSIVDARNSWGAILSLVTLKLLNLEISYADSIADLEKTLLDPTIDVESRRVAARDLAVLARFNLQATDIPEEVLDAVINLSKNSSSDYFATRDANQSVRNFILASSRNLTPRIIDNLFDQLTQTPESNMPGDDVVDFMLEAALIQPRVLDLVPRAVNALAVSVTTEKSLMFNRALAALRLAKLVSIRPDLATQDIAIIVASLMADRSYPSSYRLRAATALLKITQTSPEFELITDDVLLSTIDAFADNATNNDYYVFSNPGSPTPFSILAGMIKQNPKIFSDDKLVRLIENLRQISKSPYPRSLEGAFDAIVTLAKMRPDVVTDSVAGSLFGFATDLNVSDRYQAKALATLGELSVINPNILGAEMVQAIIADASNPQLDYQARLEAARGLYFISKAKPDGNLAESANSVARELVHNYKDAVLDPLTLGEAMPAFAKFGLLFPDLITPDVMQSTVQLATLPIAGNMNGAQVASSLKELAASNPAAITPALIAQIIKTLQSPDVSTRDTGAWAIFYLTLGVPSRILEFKVPLNELLNSPLPHVRIAAVKSLQFLAVVELVQEAQIHPELLGITRSRLGLLRDLANYNMQYSGYGTDYGISSAAAIGLNVINMLDAH